MPPATATRGHTGEYLTVSTLPSDAQGSAGPIGLGFRVPMLVISPFSRGGLVCSDMFDHTSMMRFLETRFGAEVPNLSAWRRSVTGDMTTAFNFAAPNTSKPTLPKPSLVNLQVLGSNCAAEAAGGLADEIGFSQATGALSSIVANYPVPPPPQSVPTQEPGTARRPSGPCASAAART